MNAKEAARLLGDVQQEDVLRALCESHTDLERNNWRARVFCALEKQPEVQGAAEEFARLVKGLAYVPDAFRVFLGELHFFEVEVHSPMSGNKLRAYAKFMIDLAYYDVGFRLFAVNKHGHINEVGLLPHYKDWLNLAANGGDR